MSLLENSMLGRASLFWYHLFYSSIRFQLEIIQNSKVLEMKRMILDEIKWWFCEIKKLLN